ncbi:MAG: phenylalanyl-tRNA synthetase alpha chain [Bacteroidia bacterium]|jgi:phenylalanyl-tRNA synthetase alpha chain
MKEEIEEIRKELKKIKIDSAEGLEQFRLKYLSKKGRLNDLFSSFKTISSDLKREVGKSLNEVKKELEDFFEERKAGLENTSSEQELDFDQSLPGRLAESGSRHPLSIVLDKMLDIFERMGFIISEGPEVEDDWHNFSALNFPENHPARDMQDTFFIDGEHALRTHTSSVQVRVMETQKPPIRTVSPGRVYRNEAISARSNSFFHQIEGLYIDEGVSFADLKQTLYVFVQEFFGPNTKVRFRPSYFPFTEPSAEMDIFLGTETEADRRLTKGTGWLEILGCGMVDVNVLKNCGIDSDKYTGFAFGMGIERITMFQYGIKDLRTFFENDVRFLSQFKTLS